MRTLARTKASSSVLQKISDYLILLLGIPSLSRVHLLLLHVALRALGFHNTRPTTSGETWFFAKYRSDIRSVIDIGAHDGETYGKLLSTISLSSYWGFEPHPKSIKTLKSSIGSRATLGHCAINMAVGRSTGLIDLYDYADSDGSSHASVHQKVFTSIFPSKTTSHSVQITSLDEFFAARMDIECDLLKVDTEGHELDVFLGATRFLKEVRPKFILFEFNEHAIVSKYHYFDILNLTPNYVWFRLLPRGLYQIDSTKHDFLSRYFAYSNLVGIREDVVGKPRLSSSRAFGSGSVMPKRRSIEHPSGADLGAS